jgi:hypothetical protein
MTGQPEVQAFGGGGRLELAEQVPVGSDAGGAPPGKVSLPEVVAVVVLGDRNDIAGPGAADEGHPAGGVEVSGGELRQEVPETGAGLLAVGLPMVAVLGGAIEVHRPRVPLSAVGRY